MRRIRCVPYIRFLNRRIHILRPQFNDRMQRAHKPTFFAAHCLEAAENVLFFLDDRNIFRGSINFFTHKHTSIYWLAV